MDTMEALDVLIEHDGQTAETARALKELIEEGEIDLEDTE